MSISENAEKYCSKLFGSKAFSLNTTDPEFTEFFENFAFDQVVNQNDLDDKTRMLAILAALLGCQGQNAFTVMADAALNVGVTPTELKEVVYQATAYLGIGRVLPFLTATNKVLTDKGVALPLPSQSNTNSTSRLTDGIQAQVDIFGNEMKDFYKSRNSDTVHINKWLAENCFGDYYTRLGLDYNQREMITFCFLAAQGGCQPQLVSHAVANIGLGNDKQFLIKVVSQCLPYIGYPRSLNAISGINEACKTINNKEKEMNNNLKSIFPLGEPLPEEFSKYFVGNAHLNMLTTTGVPIGNVTFEPGCRNNWHIHHKGGQILLITAGRGYYQEWGKKAQELHPGDVVNIPPEVKHWHGAAPNSFFAHLAVEVPATGACNEWLEAVSDEDYKILK